MQTDVFEIELHSCDGIEIASNSPSSAVALPAGARITRGVISVADAAAANDNSGMMSWRFASGQPSTALFDGDLATPVGGDENGQHDDIVAVKLSGVCSSSSFAVYGTDRSVDDTDLRHIRVAYSLHGGPDDWACWTQSDTGSQGGTPSFASGSIDCSTYGPSHAPNGAIFNVNGPAQYVEFAFFGRTDVFEIELVACEGFTPAGFTAVVSGLDVSEQIDLDVGEQVWAYQAFTFETVPSFFEGGIFFQQRHKGVAAVRCQHAFPLPPTCLTKCEWNSRALRSRCPFPAHPRSTSLAARTETAACAPRCSRLAGRKWTARSAPAAASCPRSSGATFCAVPLILL